MLSRNVLRIVVMKKAVSDDVFRCDDVIKMVSDDE